MQQYHKNIYIPVALYFVKKIVMPLFSKKGIYCFYSKELITELKKIIGVKPCLEIAAGNGVLTTFLNQYGVQLIATDDFSWKSVAAVTQSVVTVN